MGNITEIREREEQRGGRNRKRKNRKLQRGKEMNRDEEMDIYYESEKGE